MRITIFLLLTFFICSAMSDYYPCIDLGSSYQLCPDREGNPQNGAVLYNSRTIEKADPVTFSVLNNGYAKDKQYVYYEGEILKDVNPATFNYLEYYYATDGKNFFYAGKRMPAVDLNTFEVLTEQYFKDKNAVFHQGKIIVGANPATFAVLGYSDYAKDAENVFWANKRIKNADYPTFTVLNINVAKDKNNTYYAGRILRHIDAATVEVFEDDSYYMRDKTMVYAILEPLKAIDIASFEYLGYGYVKDKFNVYYHGRIIDGADAETFQLYTSQYGDAKDKNGYYYFGVKRISN